MSTLTRATVYTVRIAAITAATPVLAGAAAASVTAKLAGWELRQLAGLTAIRPGHAAYGRIPRAGRRPRRRRNHASAAAGGRRGRPRQAPPRSHARPRRSGPCPAGCPELVTLGTPRAAASGPHRGWWP